MTPKEKILAWVKTLDGETAAWIEDMAAAASLYAKHDRDHASQRDWDDVLDAALKVMKTQSPKDPCDPQTAESGSEEPRHIPCPTPAGRAVEIKTWTCSVCGEVVDGKQHTHACPGKPKPNPHNQPAIGDVVELEDGRKAKVQESETECRCPNCIFYAGKSQCDAGMEYGHCDAANRDDKTSIIFAPVEPDYIECEVGLNAQGDTYLCCGKGIRAYLYDIICHKDFHGFRSPEGEVFTDRSIPNDISEKWLVLLRKDGE